MEASSQAGTAGSGGRLSQVAERFGTGPGSRLVRLLGMPLFLGAVCGGLALYLGAEDLDNVERNTLSLAVIARAVSVHLQLAVISTAFVLAIAIPLGILMTRAAARRIRPAVLGVANIGQATPSLGVLALLALIVGLGFDKVVIALVIYSTLPVLRNTIVGLEQVDPALIEAGRGMGMSKLTALRRIELPLAIPVMLAGIRTALIINVGSATLATFTLGGTGTGGNGLGDLINAGLRLGRLDTVVLAGAVLTAVLALLIDWIAGVLEDLLRPRGL